MKIAQVLWAGSWGEVGPATLNKGLGGRETAMVSLAKVWADAGHDVTNFVNCDKGTRFYPESGNGYHEYLPMVIAKAVLGNMPWDAVVAWEIPSIFNDVDIKERANMKICEMQVAHFSTGELEAAEKHCDYVAALSPWHQSFLEHSGYEGNTVILPNGIDIGRYPLHEFGAKKYGYQIKKNPKFVYSSSPDRGLWNILKAWPAIRKSFPRAEIFVTYGFADYVNNTKWAHSRIAQMSIEMEQLIKQPGVTDLGKIGQDKLAKLQLEADAWLYPLDPIWPTETGCITAVENAAAGNPLIISNCDCLESEFGDFSYTFDLPFNTDDLVEGVKYMLGQPKIYREAQDLGRAFAETRTWKKIGDKWLELFQNG